MIANQRNVALNPRDSAKLITEVSKHVQIIPNGVNALAQRLMENLKKDKQYIHFKSYKNHPLNPKQADERAVAWIFLVDALNFSFWSVDIEHKYSVNYNGSNYTGYWSLCAAINRALDEGIPLLDAKFCKDISAEQVKHIFRSDSDTEIPLLNERLQIIREIGGILLAEYDGKFTKCIDEAKHSAQVLLCTVVDKFSCFRDEAVYNGQTLSFYKRAQILIADIWACFEGQNYGKFSDIDTITMFADYRIPQALVYFGVLQYSEELNGLLKCNHMFNYGDVMEMEIRAASIWSVELIVEKMRELISLNQEMEHIDINSILLDHFLWDYRRAHDAETRHVPFHKVRCIYY